MTAAYVLAGASLVLVVPTLIGERLGAPWRGWPKAAASTCFIAAAVAAGAADSSYGAWVLAALCLGWVGDVSLVSEQRRWFLIGLASFLLSHVAYIGAFAAVRPSAVVAVATAAGLVVPAALVARWLWPHLDKGMRGPVLAYLVVITAMVAASAGSAAGEGPVAVVPAAAAFAVSDILVARHHFVAREFRNRLWGLPLYYGAQVVFALSVGWL